MPPTITDEPPPCCHADPPPVSRPSRSRWRRRAYTALATLLLAVLMGIGEEAGHHLVTDTVPTVASIAK
ncbi:hypothetical protein [Embleya hyalina]|uniref:Uncharacterized protein n=1 Tax=Embleya hyalina TaxID=516124 RepID=A0A401Z3V7_9ACTN|nr:hypothetical protein [Embleya hyalina]GCE01528.1 hypothetical protein EHYA_09294 [Embleya hyalina]